MLETGASDFDGTSFVGSVFFPHPTIPEVMHPPKSGADGWEQTFFVDPAAQRVHAVLNSSEPTHPDTAGVLFEQRLGLFPTDSLQVLDGVDMQGAPAWLVAYKPPAPSLEALGIYHDAWHEKTLGEKLMTNGMVWGSFATAVKEGPWWRRALALFASMSLSAVACGGSNLALQPEQHTPPPPSPTPEQPPSTPVLLPDTPTPPPDVIDGLAPADVLAGLPPGAGGAGEEFVSQQLSESMKQALHALGLSPIAADDVVSWEQQAGEHAVVCWMPYPETIYNPDLFDQAEEVMVQNPGEVVYGEGEIPLTRVVKAIPLVGLPENIICISTYAREDNAFGVAPGSLITTLVDTRINAVVAWARGAFSADTTIKLELDETPRLLVDGVELPMTILNPAALTPPPPTETPTPEPSATPTPTPTGTPTATSTEKPTAVQPSPTPVPTPTEVPPTEIPEPAIPRQNGTWAEEGTQWECRLCTWDTSYLTSPNIRQLALYAWDGSRMIYFRDHLSVEQFLSEVEILKNKGYKPFSVDVGQDKAYGDPRAGTIAPQNLVYTMTK